MKRLPAACLSFALALALFVAARAAGSRLAALRAERGLTRAGASENLPPAVAFASIAFGGASGILADVLWLRAGDLQDAGRYFELAQLARWITELEPRNAEIWAFQAWNLAYNIPAALGGEGEKWRWVRSAVALLAEEGLRRSGGSAAVHAQLAWLFLHKMSLDIDPASAFYREAFAREGADGIGEAEGATLEEMAGFSLDWTEPAVHALYWAEAGLPRARTKVDDLALRRIAYQTLALLVQRGDARFAPWLRRELEETIARHPEAEGPKKVLAALPAPQAP
jgi:hypothetical protein